MKGSPFGLVMAALLILGVVIALVWNNSVRATKADRDAIPTSTTRITGTTVKVDRTPEVLPLDEALARGVGVIRVYDGIPKNIHIVINARTPESVSEFQLGQAMHQARKYLGNDFHFYINADKDKNRLFVMMYCTREL